jgi:Protein of unknown function (DUF3987)
VITVLSDARADVEAKLAAAALPNGHDAASPRWPNLIDIAAVDERVPPFPVHLLPAPFSTFIADIADRMQVPLDFAGIPLIAAAGAMLGSEFRLAPKLHDDWSERACLWAMIVAPTGAKKTPPMEEVLRPIRSLQSECYRRWEAEMVNWQADAGAAPLLETLLTNEGTVEALVGHMSAATAAPSAATASKGQPS